MYDEPKAVSEIRELSTDAKMHLKHLWRNFLQAVVANAELGLIAIDLPLAAHINFSHIRDAVIEHERSLRELKI